MLFRSATPFELSNVCEGLLKDMCGEVLSFRSIMNPASDVGIDPVEIAFVQLRKAARIILSSLDQNSFVRFSNPTQVSLAPVF